MCLRALVFTAMVTSKISFALQYVGVNVPRQRGLRRGAPLRVLFSSTREDTAPIRREDVAPSRVEAVEVRGRRIFVKRDDKYRLPETGLCGNKARKLYSLNNLSPFPQDLVSHGGPQSNAMVALAAVVHRHQPSSTFTYYTKPIPRWLRNNPSGNFARAISLGTEIRTLSVAEYQDLFGGLGAISGAPPGLPLPPGALWVPQGGASAEAEPGLIRLADEIYAQVEASSELAGGPVNVVVASGSGATALFLARHLHPHGIGVTAVPCVMRGGAFLRQMERLDEMTGSHGILPSILEGKEHIPFGQPSPLLLDAWTEMKQIGLYVDLLYGARTWQVLLEHWDAGSMPPSLGPGTNVLYYHCGGIEGVSTQLNRYKHAGLVSEIHYNAYFEGI